MITTITFYSNDLAQMQALAAQAQQGAADSEAARQLAESAAALFAAITAAAEHGATLVYNADSGVWEPTNEIHIP